MRKYLFIILFIFLSCDQTDTVNSVELTVSLDTNYTTIGTPIDYSIDVKSPKNKIIKLFLNLTRLLLMVTQGKLLKV